MSKKVIEYQYRSWLEGCGCCSNSETYYDVYIDDKLVESEVYIGYIENEQELREELAHLEPFEVHLDTTYF